jgi:hypothetical protein
MIVKRNGVPYAQGHQVFHFTRNANGEIKVDLWKPVMHCFN